MLRSAQLTPGLPGLGVGSGSWGVWGVCIAAVAVAIQQGVLLADAKTLSDFVLILVEDVLLLSLLLVPRPEILLYAFVFLIPVGVLGYLGPETTGTILPVLGSLLAGLWAVRVLLRQDRWIPFKGAGLLFGFSALLLVSTILNWDRLVVRSPIATHAQLLLLAALVVQLVRSRSVIRRIGWCIIGGMTVVAGLSLLYVFGIGGEALQPQEVEAIESSGGQVVRYGMISGGANWASAELLVGIAFGVNYFLGERSLLRRTFLAPALALMVVADMFTYSLTGTVGLVFVVALSLSRSGGTRSRELAKVLLLVICLGALTLLVPGVQYRVGEKIAQVQQQEASHWFSMRLGLLMASGRMLMDYPLWGVGAGNSKWYLPSYLPFVFDNELGAHNAFAEVGNDSGIPAMIVFILLCFGALWALAGVLRRMRTRAADEEFRVAVRSTYIALAGLLLMSMTLATQRMKYLWLLVGLAFAVRLLETRADDSGGNSGGRASELGPSGRER